MAPATPTVPPVTPARNGPAEAAATACRRVMPTAWSTWRSATVAEVYRATDWPMRNTAATSAASPKASRQAASYAVILPGGDADLLVVVPHVDVGAAGHPGQVGAEGGDRGLAAFEPHQRVDVRLAAGAQHVDAVPGEQGGRGEDAAGRAWRVRIEPPRGADHSHDAGPDLRPAGWPGRPVVPLVGLLRAGQLQGQPVAHMLAGGGQEFGRNHDLVGAARVEQPPGQDDRPLDGPGHLVVGEREPGARRAGSRRASNPNTTGNLVSAATSGNAAIRDQLNPGWLGRTVAVAGSVRAASRCMRSRPGGRPRWRSGWSRWPGRRAGPGQPATATAAARPGAARSR